MERSIDSASDLSAAAEKMQENGEEAVGEVGGDGDAGVGGDGGGGGGAGGGGNDVSESAPPPSISATGVGTEATVVVPATTVPATTVPATPQPPPAATTVVATTASTSATASAAAATDTAAARSVSITPEQVREEVRGWLFSTNKVLSSVDSSKLQVLLKDYDVMKDKTSKLKSLLGRSAKAQREAKVELEATQKRLDSALREIDRLNKKIDKLANRPTHMELLADFESNFDRALLHMGQQAAAAQVQHQQQQTGQDTASPPLFTPHHASSLMGHPHRLHQESDTVVDGLLMQELNESKQRIEKLEGLNAALLHRSSQLEGELLDRKRERDDLISKMSHLELEKRMAVLEAEHASKVLQEKTASLAEMQLEIDLVTKASVNANARAAQGEQLIKAVKTDKQHVQQLEAKVQALQEWALASCEAKTLAQERVRILENQLRASKGAAASSFNNAGTSGDGSLDDVPNSERCLFSKSASLVVGAGDSAVRVVTISEDLVRTVKLSERVLLRWKFDLSQEDATIAFSLLQGECATPQKRRNARYLIQDRWVKGGAAGETENAFVMDNACTILWSNVKSWIRPKTVKYTVEAIVVAY